VQTKVFDGSSVTDCLRPRRATGCTEVAAVSVLEPTALLSDGAAVLSGVHEVSWSSPSCSPDEPVSYECASRFTLVSESETSA